MAGDELRDRVLDALRTVQDPDLHRDLVTLNMIRDLEVDAGGVARFRLVLTTAACPVKKELEEACRAAATSVPGVAAAEIAVSAEVPGAKRRAEALPGVKHLIAVASAKGGVGKSTVAVNLACALAGTGARVGLLDADIYGPSVPTMMGVRRQPFVANRKIVPLENHGVRMISMGFLVEEDAAMVWRGPMLQGAVKQFVEDVAWGELDYLLIDMPPGTGDVQMSLAQLVPIAGVVIVTTPQRVAIDDVRRGVTMFRKLEVPVFGVVENMGVFVCPCCGHAEHVFASGGGGELCRTLGVPLLGEVPMEPAVRAAGDAGTPVVIAHPDSASATAFRRLAEEVARQASMAAMRTEEGAA